MSLIYHSIALYICILCLRPVPIGSQLSVTYTHSVNDCFHLCFGIQTCIEDCEHGYRVRTPPRMTSRYPRPRYGRGGREYPRRQYDYKPRYEDRGLHYYGSAALEEPMEPPGQVNRNVTSFSLSGLSQPNHCGLRYRDMRRRGADALGLGRIVGGEDAEAHEFPWLVSLQLKRQYGLKFFCAASIINEYYLLTAAHCTDSLRGKENTVIIKAGITSIKEPGQVLYAERFIVHNGWNAEIQMNDISLIKLKTPLRYTVNNLGQYMVNAVCLPTDSREPSGFAQLAGWGNLNEDDTHESEWLQKITLPIWERRRCRVNYRTHMKIERAHICAGGRGGQDTCYGDSGGALVQTKGVRTYQIGIVSFGMPCAIKGLPGVYSFLVYFMNWISNNMI